MRETCSRFIGEGHPRVQRLSACSCGLVQQSGKEIGRCEALIDSLSLVLHRVPTFS